MILFVVSINCFALFKSETGIAGLGLSVLFDDESPPPPQATKNVEQAKAKNVF
jgi:hypothetical protein